MKNLKNNPIELIIQDYKRELQKRFCFEGIHINVVLNKNEALLHGKVLIPSLLENLKKRTIQSKAGQPVSFSIEISSLTSRLNKQSYCRPIYNKIDLFSSTDKKKLSIQICRNDPPLIKVFEHGHYSLLFTPFSCYGWTDTNAIVACRYDRSYYTLKQGQSIIIDRDELDRFKHYLCSDFLEKRVSYTLGASSHEEVDCSGFIMRTIYDRFSICIPKHSEDQFNTLGRFVECSWSNFQDLDIVYAKSRLRGNKHIGFTFIDNNKVKIMEASYRKKQVILSDLENFCKRFNIIGVKRLFSLKK